MDLTGYSSITLINLFLWGLEPSCGVFLKLEVSTRSRTLDQNRSKWNEISVEESDGFRKGNRLSGYSLMPENLENCLLQRSEQRNVF